MKDLQPLNITDSRKLDKQIAQALSDVPLLFVDEEDACLIYREGIDDIPGIPYDVLPFFSTSADACLAVLPSDMPVLFSPMPDGKQEAGLGGDVWNGFKAYRGQGATRSDALCEATLKWALDRKARQDSTAETGGWK